MDITHYLELHLMGKKVRHGKDENGFLAFLTSSLEELDTVPRELVRSFCYKANPLPTPTTEST